MQKKIKEYLNQDINNPKYLFHGSPIRTTIIIPMQSHDYTGNVNNIANDIFLFPSLIKASAYAFKNTIKKNSEGLKWNFEIPNSNDFPVITMEEYNFDGLDVELCNDYDDTGRLFIKFIADDITIEKIK